MESKLRNLEIVTRNAINDAVLVRDTAGPETCQCMLQGFGLPDPFIVTSRGVLDQLVYPSDHFPIRLEPILVVLPSLRRKDKVHASTKSLMLFFRFFPLFRLSMEVSNRLALAGDRSRYAVS